MQAASPDGSVAAAAAAAGGSESPNTTRSAPVRNGDVVAAVDTCRWWPYIGCGAVAAGRTVVAAADVECVEPSERAFT